MSANVAGDRLGFVFILFRVHASALFRERSTSLQRFLQDKKCDTSGKYLGLRAYNLNRKNPFFTGVSDPRGCVNV